jgi:hypothetical protein
MILAGRGRLDRRLEEVRRQSEGICPRRHEVGDRPVRVFATRARRWDSTFRLPILQVKSDGLDSGSAPDRKEFSPVCPAPRKV